MNTSRFLNSLPILLFLICLSANYLLLVSFSPDSVQEISRDLGTSAFILIIFVVMLASFVFGIKSFFEILKNDRLSIPKMLKLVASGGLLYLNIQYMFYVTLQYPLVLMVLLIKKYK